MPQRFAKTRNEPATCSHARVPPSGASGGGRGTVRVVATFSPPASAMDWSSDGFNATEGVFVLAVEVMSKDKSRPVDRNSSI